jgi:hypothetical protein
MAGAFRVMVQCAATAALTLLGAAQAQAGGAIAIGPCAAYGYAYDYRDLAEAQSAALAKCADRSCKLAVTLRRACGAFAVDGRNACGAHGYAVAPRLGQAQNRALQECHNFGGRECVIRAWACDAKG